MPYTPNAQQKANATIRGHSSPATTAIYAATADSDLDLIAEAVAR